MTDTRNRTPLADALAKVDTMHDTDAAGELPALRELAEVVRAHLADHPEFDVMLAAEPTGRHHRKSLLLLALRAVCVILTARGRQASFPGRLPGTHLPRGPRGSPVRGALAHVRQVSYLTGVKLPGTMEVQAPNEGQAPGGSRGQVRHDRLPGHGPGPQCERRGEGAQRDPPVL